MERPGSGSGRNQQPQQAQSPQQQQQQQQQRDPSLNFFSPRFDAARSLATAGLLPPVPGARPLDNIYRCRFMLPEDHPDFWKDPGRAAKSKVGGQAAGGMEWLRRCGSLGALGPQGIWGGPSDVWGLCCKVSPRTPEAPSTSPPGVCAGGGGGGGARAVSRACGAGAAAAERVSRWSSCGAARGAAASTAALRPCSRRLQAVVRRCPAPPPHTREPHLASPSLYPTPDHPDHPHPTHHPTLLPSPTTQAQSKPH